MKRGGKTADLCFWLAEFMLDTVDLTNTLDSKSYKQEMKELEKQVAALQQKIKDYKIPLLIVFEGWSAAGKGSLISKILYPLDPRYFNVITTDKLNEDALLRPFLWQYAKNTPSEGRITIFDKSWYSIILPEGAENRKLTSEEKAEFYYDVNSFEQRLTESGMLIIKFFLHISKDVQKKRFEEFEKNKDTSWRVDDNDRKQNKEYEKYKKLFNNMLNQSNSGSNKWHIIEANDRNYATVKLYKIIIEKINEEIKRRSDAISLVAKDKQEENIVKSVSILSSVDPSKDISKNEYKEKLAFYQNKISHLGLKLYAKRKSVIIVYEGWDAAGKGGNIKRLTQQLDPRGYDVKPVGVPTTEELNHHYLWRFWNSVPKDGHIAIFDRSWYGRVLVERVEGFCSQAEWQRAYKEINDMEKHFYNHGSIIIKFWIHIDKDEQLTRFKARQENPLKNYKITDEDWRNRDKWEFYESAADEMLLKTNTNYAPWVVVESNNKKYARIKTLEYVTTIMENKLKD